MDTDRILESDLSDELEAYFDRLWPLPRSITGPANRETLNILSELVPWDIIEIPSGEQVFDWTVPPEYSVRAAYITTPSGEKICDFSENNLHLVGYAESVDLTLSREDLDKYLYSLPQMPNAIPYVTSYYRRKWGFCLTHAQREALPSGDYHVYIDSTFDPKGSMTLAECVLPGETDQEILFSSYFCHPSMANNELSGPLVLSFLYRELSKQKNRKYTYRFLLCPETIGSIAYLHKNGEHLKKTCVGGLVITCVGDQDTFIYKRSSRGDGAFDEMLGAIYRGGSMAIGHSLREVRNFNPFGGDERQFCSQGFDLPIGAISTTFPGEYKEYHTSLDNKNYISFSHMSASVSNLILFCYYIENNDCYLTKFRYGEPFLTKHDIYPEINSKITGNPERFLHDMKWILHMSNGKNRLFDICEYANIHLNDGIKIAKLLVGKRIVEIID